MTTVLILTSAEKRRDLLGSHLQQEDLVVAHLSDPASLAALTLENTPDILLLDTLSLSAEQVEEVLAKGREMRLPILALLAEEALATHSFSNGPDDFLLEPLRGKELAARVHQLLWRLKGRQGKGILRVGDLVIDLERYQVSVGGREAILTFKEYELLRLLASNPGHVFTRETLLSKVWGYDYFGGTRTVDVHVRRLRSKIEDARHTFIETVWNVGYRFKEPVG